MDFVGAISKITQGLLFGTETFFLFNLIRYLISILWVWLDLCEISIFWDSIFWLFLALGLLATFYFFHKNYKHNYVIRAYNSLFGTFEALNHTLPVQDIPAELIKQFKEVAEPSHFDKIRESVQELMQKAIKEKEKTKEKKGTRE